MLMAARYGRVLSAFLCSAAFAATPPPPEPQPPPGASQPKSQPTQPQSPGAAPAADAAAADDELIEFLGADDVGDVAWWEFLKKSPPRKVPPPPGPTSQDAKP